MSGKIETHFSFDEQLMLQILGDNNFPDIYSPFIELIKNAYDACVEREVDEKLCYVNIDLEKQLITIEDNGCGMDENDLHNKWLVVGKSFKKTGKHSLSYQGDKGIGRIAINKISNHVEMYSQKEKANYSCYWESNWESSFYELKEKMNFVGTKFILGDLRKKWDEKDISKLHSILSILIYYIKDFKLFFNGEIVENRLPIEIVNQDYDYSIDFSYDSSTKTINYHLVENEFDATVLSSILPSIYNKTREMKTSSSISDAYNEYNKQNKLLDDYHYSETDDCGSFFGTILFRRGKTNQFQIERFHYKDKGESLKCDNGILIYRDNFIVRPFGIGGKNDFFDLSGRVRRSPATHTKEDGRWRARLNNITGYVSITKENNPNLVDQSNRNGFEENRCLDCFRIIVDSALDLLERERQKLTVAINKMNQKNESNQTKNSYYTFVNKLVSRAKGKKTINISSDEVRIIENNRTLQEEAEINTNYDMKRMVYYTTQGLLTLSKYHEIKNECDFIETFKDDVIDSIIQVGCLDFLENKFKGKQLTDNMFLLIDKMQDINNINASYSRKIMKEEKKSNFDENIIVESITTIIGGIILNWKDRVKDINIITNASIINGKDHINLSKSDILSIFDNLILNSMQANSSDLSNLIISIDINDNDGFLNIEYSDNGVGLSDIFKGNEYAIFEYGTKGKEGGHGIGMWIVKKIVDMATGEVKLANSGNGFSLEMSIPISPKKEA